MRLSIPIADQKSNDKNNIQMAGKERPQRRDHSPQAQPDPPSDNEQESNETMPIHAHDTALDRVPSGETAHGSEEDPYSFLRHKPIRRRHKNPHSDSNERLRQQVRALTNRVAELEEKLREAHRLEDACPHCHFYLTQPLTPTPTPTGDTPSGLKRSASGQSLEFEQVDFHAPLMYSREMEEKSWIFLGTLLIAMGSKVTDTDGTLNVFKVVKESVDQIRRQVDKSSKRISLDFFLGREELAAEAGMDELDFDPFYQQQEAPNGLQLESVRVQSVEQYELIFDQKITFNINYDALITAMEYMKENSSLAFT